VDVTPEQALKGSAPHGPVPPNGRLPDASQGAAHLREVFGRMGFSDREIVALSGGHTLGRCHSVRSGFDGPWTDQPLRFNNDYFKNLMDLDWEPRNWTGPRQFANVGDGRLMMLPTDLALKTDPAFAKFARAYADDETLFFKDFRLAYAKLMALGCPAKAVPAAVTAAAPAAAASVHFREHVMHGSLARAQEWVAAGANVHELETGSGRSALHKAAFWNHTHVLPWLLEECRIDPNGQVSAFPVGGS
jgi:hypothetical protein